MKTKAMAIERVHQSLVCSSRARRQRLHDFSGITWVQRAGGRRFDTPIVGLAEVMAVVYTPHMCRLRATSRIIRRAYTRAYTVSLDGDCVMFGGEDNAVCAYDLRRLLPGRSLAGPFTSAERSPDVVAAAMDIEYASRHTSRHTWPAAPYLPTTMLAFTEKLPFQEGTSPSRAALSPGGILGQVAGTEDMDRMLWERSWLAPDHLENPTKYWLLPHYICPELLQRATAVFLDFRLLLGQEVDNPVKKIRKASLRPVTVANPAEQVLGTLSYLEAVNLRAASVGREAAAESLRREWRALSPQQAAFADIDVQSALQHPFCPAQGFRDVYATVLASMPGDHAELVTDDDLSMAVCRPDATLALSAVVRPSLWNTMASLWLPDSHRFAMAASTVDLWSPPAKRRREFGDPVYAGNRSRPADNVAAGCSNNHVASSVTAEGAVQAGVARVDAV